MSFTDTNKSGILCKLNWDYTPSYKWLFGRYPVKVTNLAGETLLKLETTRKKSYIQASIGNFTFYYNYCQNSESDGLSMPLPEGKLVDKYGVLIACTNHISCNDKRLKCDTLEENRKCYCLIRDLFNVIIYEKRVILKHIIEHIDGVAVNTGLIISDAHYELARYHYLQKTASVTRDDNVSLILLMLLCCYGIVPNYGLSNTV